MISSAYTNFKSLPRKIDASIYTSLNIYHLRGEGVDVGGGSDASMGIRKRFAAQLGSCSCAKLHLRQVQLWLLSWKCNRMPAHIPLPSFLFFALSLYHYISLSDVWHMLDICLGSNWLRLRLRLRSRRLHLPVECRPIAICVYAQQGGSNGC